MANGDVSVAYSIAQIGKKKKKVLSNFLIVCSGMFEAENEASKTALEKRQQSLGVEGLRQQKTDLEKQLKELEKKLGKGSPHREE